MKKKYMAALAAGAAAGIWCASRDKKYPVCRELRFVNKLAVPGWAIGLGTAKLSVAGGLTFTLKPLETPTHYKPLGTFGTDNKKMVLLRIPPMQYHLFLFKPSGEMVKTRPKLPLPHPPPRL